MYKVMHSKILIFLIVEWAIEDNAVLLAPGVQRQPAPDHNIARWWYYFMAPPPPCHPLTLVFFLFKKKRKSKTEKEAKMSKKFESNFFLTK